MSAPPTTRVRYRFGVFELNPVTRELRKREVRLKLAAQPFTVLLTLVERRGEVVRRDDLRQILWPGQEWGEYESKLNKAIHAVREVLSDSPETPRYVETLTKLGYRFIMPVEVLEEPAAMPGPTPAAVPPAPTSPEPEVSVAPAQQNGRTRWWITGTAGLMCAAFYMALILRPGHEMPTQPLVSETLSGSEGRESNPAYSSDGRRVAFSLEGSSDSGTDIHIANVGQLAPERITSDPRRDFAPAWSPDDKVLAFLREEERGRSTVVLWNIEQRAERPLASIQYSWNVRPTLNWSPDGEWLVLPETAPDGRTACFAMSVANGNRKRLTSPPDSSRGDSWPAVSPDGKYLAFARATSRQWKEVFLVELGAGLQPQGQPRQITSGDEEILGLAWSANSSSVVYAAGPWGGASSLKRASIVGRAGSDVGTVRIHGSEPAIPRRAGGLAYVQRSERSSIWRVDVADGARTGSNFKPVIRLAANSQDPVWSPDGKQIAFVTSLGAVSEVWLAGQDGKGLRKVASVPNSSIRKPHWSRDQKRLFVETRTPGQSEIFVVDVSTGLSVNLSNHPGDEFLPSLSNDGEWLYFCSTRSGSPQVWRMPVNGGAAATQMTTEGGLSSQESPDTKWLYFTSKFSPSPLFRRSLETGTTEKVVDEVISMPGFLVTADALYYLTRTGRQTWQLRRIKEGREYPRAVETLATFERPVRDGLSFHPDGRSVLLSLADEQSSTIMQIPGFRD